MLASMFPRVDVYPHVLEVLPSLRRQASAFDGRIQRGMPGARFFVVRDLHRPPTSCSPRFFVVVVLAFPQCRGTFIRRSTAFSRNSQNIKSVLQIIVTLVGQTSTQQPHGRIRICTKSKGASAPLFRSPFQANSPKYMRCGITLLDGRCEYEDTDMVFGRGPFRPCRHPLSGSGETRQQYSTTRDIPLNYSDSACSCCYVTDTLPVSRCSIVQTHFPFFRLPLNQDGMRSTAYHVMLMGPQEQES